jgi:hypothetical protein
LRRFLFLLLLPLVPLAQERVDGTLGEHALREGRLYLRTPDEVRRLAPGFEGLMADLYWLRTVQYFGAQRAFGKDPHYDLLRPLIDITTGLDPRFELAYRYGAVFLSEVRPFGAGKPAEGIEVLEAGVRHLPQSWRLRWDLGSFYFVFMQDTHKAAEVLIEARRLPNAPYWLESLAGKFLMGDDRDAARGIWRRQFETGEGLMRENAAYHLEIIDALDQRDAIGALVARFREASGRLPRGLEELKERGLVTALPRDPSGEFFDYNEKTGDVSISRRSRLWRSSYE